MGFPEHVEVLERGWLHGNVVALPGPHPAVVDSGYCTGAEATVAFVRAHLPEGPERVVLTHVHSDHAGGVAALTLAWGAPVWAHDDAVSLVSRWDARGLWLEHTGQHLPPFVVDHSLGPTVPMGRARWEVLATPGHATGGVSLFDPEAGLAITGDALWEDGFGLLDPWVDGPGVFDDTRAALDRLAARPIRWVVPGHGAPFEDAPGAIARARERLAYLEAHPERLQAQVVRNFAGFFGLLSGGVSPEELSSRCLEVARAHPVAGCEPERVVAAVLERLLPSAH